MNTPPTLYDQYRQAVQNLPPPPQMAAPSMPSTAPQMAPPTLPNVQKPAPGQLPYDQEQRSKDMMAGPGEEQLYHKITRSQFGQNHPILGKVLGGLAAGATGAADIGLDTLGGGMGRLASEQIPGTILNHQVTLNRDNKAVTQDEANNQKEAETANIGATAAHTAEETNEMPGKTASEEGLQGAQTDEAKARSTALQNPADEWSIDNTYQGPNGEPVEVNKRTGQARIAPSVQGIIRTAPKEATPPHITAMLHGQSHIMERDPKTGDYSIDRGIAPPSYAGMMPMVLGTKTATFIDPATNLPTEQQFNPKTGTYDRPLGLSASNAYGHEAAQAGAVERSGNDLIQVLQAHRAQIGTLGAWVKLHGLNTPIADPTLEGIRAQLASFAALNPAMHGARGSQAMQHFEDVIGGAQQNPDATIAGIQGIIRGAAQPILGQDSNGGNPQGAPQPGTVENGYRFKGGDVTKQSNWEKVAK